MTHSFDVEIAREYGVDEAIVLSNLFFWIQKNEANKRHCHDGRYWTYNSIEAFGQLFPYWSKDHIRRLLKKMEDRGLIFTGNYNSVPYDRTCWYAICDSLYSILRNCRFDLAKVQNGSCESAEPIPDSNPDSNPDISTDKGTEKPPDKPARESKVFIPPTIDEVRAYCQERNKHVDPERWYNHYLSNGWMVGKTKMKDWKAAVRTWEGVGYNAGQTPNYAGNNVKNPSGAAGEVPHLGKVY